VGTLTAPLLRVEGSMPRRTRHVADRRLDAAHAVAAPYGWDVALGTGPPPALYQRGLLRVWPDGTVRIELTVGSPAEAERVLMALARADRPS
jgi:hypothetical protein